MSGAMDELEQFQREKERKRELMSIVRAFVERKIEHMTLSHVLSLDTTINDISETYNISAREARELLLDIFADPFSMLETDGTIVRKSESNMMVNCACGARHSTRLEKCPKCGKHL